MREIYCNDKDCQVLPPAQSPVDTGGENTSSATAPPGLVPDSASMQVPLSAITPRARRGRKKKTGRKKRGKRGSGIVKRLQRLQIGGRRRRKSKKSQQSGGSRKRKCVKRKRS